MPIPLPELADLARIGKLKAEPGTQVEFDGLMPSGNVRLRDAQNASNSIGSRFEIANNAAHGLSLAPAVTAFPFTRPHIS